MKLFACNIIQHDCVIKHQDRVYYVTIYYTVLVVYDKLGAFMQESRKTSLRSTTKHVRRQTYVTIATTLEHTCCWDPNAEWNKTLPSQNKLKQKKKLQNYVKLQWMNEKEKKNYTNKIIVYSNVKVDEIFATKYKIYAVQHGMDNRNLQIKST